MEKIKIEIKNKYDEEYGLITIYYAELLRKYQLHAEALHWTRIQAIDVKYLQEIEAITIRYQGLILELEAEWTIKIKIETTRIGKEANVIIVNY